MPYISSVHTFVSLNSGFNSSLCSLCLVKLYVVLISRTKKNWTERWSDICEWSETKAYSTKPQPSFENTRVVLGNLAKSDIVPQKII